MLFVLSHGILMTGGGSCSLQRGKIFHGVSYLRKKWSLNLVDLQCPEEDSPHLEESSNISRREGSW